MNSLLNTPKECEGVIKLSTQMKEVLGEKVNYEGGYNFRVKLAGNYELSYSFLGFGRVNITYMETALILNNEVIYIPDLDYMNVIIHSSTLEEALAEYYRVKNLLNKHANVIRNAYLNYKNRKQAVIIIQRQFRKSPL